MNDYNFNVAEATNGCINWIRNWFQENGKGCNAIVGISGGKDSSVVAALCAQALGRERVIGVMMPNGEQTDIADAVKLINFLDIRSRYINIQESVNGILKNMTTSASEQTKINLPARIRMATLYAVSQSNNGRVANTCNYSEDYLGYATRYGDGAGDFSPLAHFTVQEVKQIGAYLGLPEELVNKTPSDGLCGKTDEDSLGFTYKELDDWLRFGTVPSNPSLISTFKSMYAKNKFKLEPMPSYNYFN